MPSVSKPQATLMAMAAHNAAFAKKRGIPQRVAHEFNQADKRTGILKRGAGGAAPLESGLDSHLNFGLGHGRNFFSTTPLMGHAMSGTPLGGKRFAEGGEVKTPAGPSAKERREIRDLIERGKEDAIETLRASRNALLSMQPLSSDTDSQLAGLRDRLMKADGGEVSAEEAEPVYDDPAQLYEEYMDLLEQMGAPDLDPQMQATMVDRLADIESKLDALGIDVAEGESPQ